MAAKKCFRNGCNWNDRKENHWVTLQYQRNDIYFCDYECLLLWLKLEKGKKQDDKNSSK